MTDAAIVDIAEDYHHDAESTDVFGFWLYILTDCLLFGCLFATYLVLNHPHAYGPSLKEYIDLTFVLGETLLLLGSNFTFGLAMLSMNGGQLRRCQMWLVATFILGFGFIAMELYEFIHLAHEGYSWTSSGAASSFFTLVGTHGLHVSFGLIWIMAMIVHFNVFGIKTETKRRMIYLGLFWNFLDIVWIFLFSIVYLMGVL